MWLNIVNQPFPINTWRRYWVRAVGFGGFVFLFLFLFKPFRLDLYPTGRLFYTSGVYGLITGLVIFAGSFLLIKVIAPYINEERWTLGKQILWNTLLMVFIAVLNVLATQLMVGVPIPLSFYFTMLGWVFLLGILPISIAELLTYNHYLRRHVRNAAEMSQLMRKANLPESIQLLIDSSQTEVVSEPGGSLLREPLNDSGMSNNHETKLNKLFVPESLLVLEGENQRDNLELHIDSLLAVQSLDNYVNIFWENQGKLKTTLLRNTLTNIANQLETLPFLFRTHRGWLVNTKKVKQVEGNAQGLKLSVGLMTLQVPVSRGNIAAYRELTESDNMVLN